MSFAHEKIVYKVLAKRSLHGLYALRSDLLCAVGVGQFLASFDGGSTWNELTSRSFGDRFVLAVAECDSVDVLFLETESETEIWAGVLGQGGWELVSRLPHSTSLSVGFSWDRTIVVALQQGKYLHVYVSVDSAKTWDSTLQLPFPGTLTHFEVNELGVGLAIMLDTRHRPDGTAFESTIITLDAISGRVKATRTLRANIQSACRVQESSWLLGADYGMLFSYDADTEALETKMIFEDDRLNISAIDVTAGKMCLIAETSDPPPDVFIIQRTPTDEWTSHRTDVSSFVWGTKQVRDGIVILTETTICKLFTQN
jgi:hypothetical protein